MSVERVENMCGGKGHVLIERILGEKELNGKCGLYAKVTIEPNCSLGYHEHHHESETYYILKGTARFNDNGTEHILCPGDVAFTGSGDGHGIEALEGPVEMIALILYENEPSQ